MSELEGGPRSVWPPDTAPFCPAPLLSPTLCPWWWEDYHGFHEHHSFGEVTADEFMKEVCAESVAKLTVWSLCLQAVCGDQRWDHSSSERGRHCSGNKEAELYTPSPWGSPYHAQTVLGLAGLLPHCLQLFILCEYDYGLLLVSFSTISSQQIIFILSSRLISFRKQVLVNHSQLG